VKVIAVMLPHPMATDVLAAARAVSGALVRVSVPRGTALDSVAALGISPAHVSERGGDEPGDAERATFADFFRRGAKQVLLVCADSVAPPASVFEEAFAALAANPTHVVLGPVSTGVYYLLGFSAPTVPDLFTGVRAGTKYAFMDTLRRCEFEERRVTFLPMLDAG